MPLIDQQAWLIPRGAAVQRRGSARRARPGVHRRLPAQHAAAVAGTRHHHRVCAWTSANPGRRAARADPRDRTRTELAVASVLLEFQTLSYSRFPCGWNPRARPNAASRSRWRGTHAGARSDPAPGSSNRSGSGVPRDRVQLRAAAAGERIRRHCRHRRGVPTSGARGIAPAGSRWPCSTRFPRASYTRRWTSWRWLDRCLGPARDWDVFVLSTLPQLLHALVTTPACSVSPHADATARGGRAHCARCAGECTVHSAAAWAEWTVSAPSLGEPIDAQAQPRAPRPCSRSPSARSSGASEVIKRGRGHAQLDHADCITAHRGKKLRYAAEFVGGLFERKAVRAYLGALTRLQELLAG